MLYYALLHVSRYSVHTIFTAGWLALRVVPHPRVTKRVGVGEWGGRFARNIIHQCHLNILLGLLSIITSAPLATGG